MNCDVGEATEGLENDQSRAHSPTFPSLHLRLGSFSNPSVALPTSQLILQTFRCFTYATAHSPTLLSLLLSHRLFTYVTWRAAHGKNGNTAHSEAREVIVNPSMQESACFFNWRYNVNIIHLFSPNRWRNSKQIPVTAFLLVGVQYVHHHFPGTVESAAVSVCLPAWVIVLKIRMISLFSCSTEFIRIIERFSFKYDHSQLSHVVRSGHRGDWLHWELLYWNEEVFSDFFVRFASSFFFMYPHTNNVSVIA